MKQFVLTLALVIGIVITSFSQVANYTKLIEELKATTISSIKYDMNNPSYAKLSSIKDGNSKVGYGLMFNNYTPKGYVFLFRSISDKANNVKYVSNTVEFDSVMSYDFSCRINRFIAIDEPDTVKYAILSPEKTTFELRKAQVPTVWIEDMKAMSFEQRLLILAYSSRFWFNNILQGKTEASFSRLDFNGEATVLLNDRSYVYNSDVGKFYQNIENAMPDKKKANKIAKQYADKIEKALAGISYKVEGCGDDNLEKCDEDGDYTYKKVFIVTPQSGTIFFDEDKNATDGGRYMFKISVESYIDGGYRPRISIKND